jgi:hypothetical protein
MTECRFKNLFLAAVLLLTALPLGARELTGVRADLEEVIEGLAAAYRTTPGDVEVRRAYADALFKLGDVWEANDVISPLATADSSNAWDLELGGRTALLTLDLDRAERLYKRLLAIAEPGSDTEKSAQRGLVMVYYQRQDFEGARSIPLPDEDDESRSFVEWMQLFEGEPYQIEWTAADRTAHLPFTNDIKQPGALPEVELKVNGHKVLLTLDTGGDRLYLDVSVAEKVGMRELTMDKAKYAYTGGKYVDEPLGVVEEVELGGVTLRNVPAVGAHWNANGPTTDGVIGTALLKQFLSTIDYEKKEITLRPRGAAGKASLMRSVGNRDLTRMPYFMTGPHLMFAKGQMNGRERLNLFMDSGLAMSMPMIIVNETTELMGLEKNELDGTSYYWVALDDHGLAGMPGGPSQALGNVFVEGDNYRNQGFFWDALISHQYLWKQGFWVIDFDTMSYYFPAETDIAGGIQDVAEPASDGDRTKIALTDPAPYVGDYDVGGGAAILKVSAQGNTLYLQAPGQQPVALEAYSDGTFGIPLAAAIIEFEGDPATGITALNLKQGAALTRGVKKQ